MGMIKDMNSQFGVGITYWHIGGLSYDKRNKNLRVTVYGYVSQKARLAGATSLITREYVLPTDGKEEVAVDISTASTDGILARVYAILTTAMVSTPTYTMAESPSVTYVESPFSAEFYGAVEA
jgi:hypothetical protein